jgi:hypothetical protein
MTRTRLRAVGGGIALVAVLAALGWWLWPRPEPAAAHAHVAKPKPTHAGRRPTPPLYHAPPMGSPREEAPPPPEIATVDTDVVDTGTAAPELTGVVVDTRGNLVPNAMVAAHGCNERGGGVLAVDGGRFSLRVDETPCTLRARRRDGALFVDSERVSVGFDSATVTLVLPAERTGGLGIQIAAVPDGIRVERVYPGTPAARVGLHEGDVITEVDGTPAAALSVGDFIAAMTGPEGSRVGFRWATPTDTGFAETEAQIRRTYFAMGDDGQIRAEPLDTGG